MLELRRGFYSEKHEDTELLKQRIAEKNDIQSDRVLNDIVAIGQKGGALGRAMVANLVVEGGVTINLESTSEHKSQVETNIATQTITLYDKPLYFDLSDVRRDVKLFRAGHRIPGVKIEEDFLRANDIAWNSETILGHELGHALIELHDPFNVILVHNRLARSFKSNGMVEIETKHYNDEPLIPRNNARELPVYDHKGGSPRYREIDSAVTKGRRTVPKSEWWNMYNDSHRKVEEFIKRWRVP